LIVDAPDGSFQIAYLERPIPELPPGSEVLDVGCGGGRYMGQLARRGVRIVGVDANKHAVAECRERGLNVIVGVAEKLPFEDRSFDAIVCNGVLPYVRERACIQEWARVLRPGGTVFVMTHGIGYALWVIVHTPFLETKAYGAMMLVSTVLYRITGKRLGYFVHTTRWLETAYRRAGFTLEHSDEQQRLWGFPVVIYHQIRKQ